MEEEKLSLKNFYHAANLVLLIFLAGMILFYHPQLPAKIPIHFAADGTPNGWDSKGSLIALFFVALGINVLFYLPILSMRWLSEHPAMLNIPRKKLFLALPMEKQQIFWEFLKEYLAAFVVAMNILWVSTIWGTIRVARGDMEKLPPWAIWTGLVLIVLVNIIYLPRMLLLPKKLTPGA